MDTMYSRGPRQTDFILVDSTIEPAIKSLETLGLNKGIISDHIVFYIDCDETILSNGIINWPVLNLTREFTIEHADKAEQFIKRFRELLEEIFWRIVLDSWHMDSKSLAQLMSLSPTSKS